MSAKAQTKLTRILKGYCQQRGSLQKAATSLRMPKSTLESYLKGHVPSLTVAANIARTLGVSIDALVEDLPQARHPGAGMSARCPTCGAERPARIAVSLESIRDSVSAATGIAPDVLQGRSRAPRTVEARDLFVWLAREKGWSLSSIGRFLDRDHTTVLAAQRRHAARVAVPETAP